MASNRKSSGNIPVGNFSPFASGDKQSRELFLKTLEVPYTIKLTYVNDEIIKWSESETNPSADLLGELLDSVTTNSSSAKEMFGPVIAQASQMAAFVGGVQISDHRIAAGFLVNMVIIGGFKNFDDLVYESNVKEFLDEYEITQDETLDILFRTFKAYEEINNRRNSKSTNN